MLGLKEIRFKSLDDVMRIFQVVFIRVGKTIISSFRIYILGEKKCLLLIVVVKVLGLFFVVFEWFYFDNLLIFEQVINFQEIYYFYWLGLGYMIFFGFGGWNFYIKGLRVGRGSFFKEK